MNSSFKSLVLAPVLTTVAIGMALPSAVFAKGWQKNSLNDPNGFNVNWHPTRYTYKLYEMPREGAVANDHIPWADSYWPSNRGGMTYRWKNFQREDMDQTLTLDQRRQMFFDIHHYPRSELLALKATNPNEYKRVMSILSPLEKFALYVSKPSKNDYYNDTMLKEFRKSSQAEREYWEGYCHAWAPAASHFAEPMPVTKVTSDGLEIPFYTADVKALLVADYQQKTSSLGRKAIGRFFDKSKKAQVRFVGKRCELRFQYPVTKVKKGVEMMADYGDTDGLSDAQYLSDYAPTFQKAAIRLNYDLGDSVLNVHAGNFIEQTRKNMEACENTNAGAFHVVTANQLGIMKEGFEFDKTRDVEVWNQPAYKYKSQLEVLKDANGNPVTSLPTSAPGTVSVVHAKTTLWYADDSDYGWAYSAPTLLSLFSFEQGAKMGSYLVQDLINTFKNEFDKYSRLLMNEGDDTEMQKYPAGIMDAAHYEYTLDIDASGQIIGGDWISYDRPDYMWIMKKEGFFDDFKRLDEIYQPVSIPADQVANLDE
ncbi:MAG: hypothetical protein JST80_03470 [Bdellovibrionales bacterium]|nr:hypothetical protein [Bdellovibrionales bacterium]